MSTKATEQDKDSNPNMNHPESDYKDESGDVPVQADAPVDEPDPETANSDAQLEADEKDAIDKSNIVDSRTRSKPQEGAMREPGDEEGIPTDD